MNCILDQLNTDVFKTNGLVLTDFAPEPEGKEYAAGRFNLNEKFIIYREAKITPKKIGQFVTCWKRNKEGITAPFDDCDELDFYLIHVTSDNEIGMFLFPKSILIKKGIIRSNLKDGKRGFRVYPNWDKPQSKQALKTQSWQTEYFIDLKLPLANSFLTSALS